MVRGIEGNEMSTPKPKSKPTPSQSSKNQKTLFGFFQKKAAPSPTPASITKPKDIDIPIPTPTSSIGPAEISSPPALIIEQQSAKAGGNKENGLPSPITSDLNEEVDGIGKEGPNEPFSSPSRRVSHLSFLIWSYNHLTRFRERRRSAMPSPTMKTMNPSVHFRPILTAAP